jgi:hypothetical protein
VDAIREKTLGREREGEGEREGERGRERERERERGGEGGHHSPTLVPGKPQGAKIGAEE